MVPVKLRFKRVLKMRVEIEEKPDMFKGLSSKLMAILCTWKIVVIEELRKRQVMNMVKTDIQLVSGMATGWVASLLKRYILINIMSLNTRTRIMILITTNTNHILRGDSQCESLT